MAANAGTLDAGRGALVTLMRRELVRFGRQPTRIIASLGTVLVFWLLAGSGFARSFIMPAPIDGSEAAAITYAAFLLPGMVTMMVMFSAVLSAISLIQDRHSGFLQAAMVSPAPAWSVAGAKVLGGALVATIQAAPLLLVAPAVGLRFGFGMIPALLAAALTAAAVIALGLALAWVVNSISGFHGVMNLVLMPMWVLSGAVFPVEGASAWLRQAVAVNPLHWCTRAIGGSLGVGEPASIAQWGGVLLFALAAMAFALLVMGRVRIGASSEGEA